MSRRRTSRIRSSVVLAVAAALVPLGSGTAGATTTAPAPVSSAYCTSVVAGQSSLPADAATFMKAYCEWGAAPDVPKYMKLFTDTGTLMDSGLPAPINKIAIEAQMDSLLKAVDYHFQPVSAVPSADGRVVFVKARNFGNIGTNPNAPGPAFDYITTHRLVLDGTRVEQGRRFWDQTELFRSLNPALPNLFATVPAVLPAEPRTRNRLTAWNTRDSAALVAGVDDVVKLTGPGLGAQGLTRKREMRAYLEHFFTRVHDLRLEPGRTVRQGPVTYREWVGHAELSKEGGTKRTITYGITERFTRDARGDIAWDLAFETLDLVADECEINNLRRLLFPHLPECRPAG
ncbi:nuclear transport factor 2 family protein [Streptomyces qinzhouensis]|uniref:Nuclear transport factor 2 family protein n=1 Tax=Streptomyces qinzhouensis TaxID=2599401 RepID=A0A5B8JKX8_9ACTN|nr:nuclear transport factor 2 family protein [Streptomyces qinzhouensis]QDY80561.1 nuclear transport factor 2 family protein [Streptomyces qinzhouensis]